MSPIANAVKLAAMNVKSQTHKIDGKTYLFKTKLTAEEAEKRVAEKKVAEKPKVADSSEEVKANSAKAVAARIAEFKSGEKKDAPAPAPAPKAADTTNKMYLKKFWDASAKPFTPIDGWLIMGKKIIRNAIRRIVIDITNGDVKPSSFYINVPLGKMIPKEYIVGKGAWNQGEEVGISFDSPDVSFADDDALIGARIGIHWTEKDAPEDEPGKAWWGCVRLALTVSKDGKETWETHARTEYERADDERIDNYVEKRLKALDKHEGYSGNALEAIKKANEEVVRVMEAK